MTKPMDCPLTYIDKHAPIRECTPDCALAVNVNGKYSCCFPVIARILSGHELNINFRSLEDDDEDKHSDLSPEAQRVYDDLMHKLETDDFKDDAE